MMDFTRGWTEFLWFLGGASFVSGAIIALIIEYLVRHA